MSNMPRWLKSIRVKLTLWYTFILLITLTAFGLVAYTYVRQTLEENLDRSLENEVKWVKTYIESKASKVKPSKIFRVKKKSPKDLPTPVPQLLYNPETAAGDPDEEIWNHVYEHALLNTKNALIEVVDKKTGNSLYSVGGESLVVTEVPLNVMQLTSVKNKKGENLRVATTSTENINILAAYRLDELKDLLDNLFFIFIILIPIAGVLSIGGGWFLANKSLRPVDTVTKTAREITAHNLDQRLPITDVNDEIGRLSSTFNEMIARLNSSFQQMRQFSVDASHELRTPLTIMRGEAEMALRSPQNADQYRTVLASTIEEIARLTSIIDSLATLSKADLGQVDVKFETVNMKEMMDELYEDAEILAMKKEIQVKVEHEEDAFIFGDKVRLRQLLLNLVDNAIKYTPEKGNVSLSLFRLNGNVKISVQDTGIGIPENEQQKIFDRFYRVDKARSRDLGGSGLGLSIVKWIVELHHGKIEVDSEVQKGSTFTVWLPGIS
ncbi:MAG: sensor histidine kinase [Bacteroidota bacterium]